MLAQGRPGYPGDRPGDVTPMQLDIPTGFPILCALFALCFCLHGLAKAIRAAARDIADAKIRAAHEVANVIRGHSPIILRVRDPHE